MLLVSAEGPRLQGGVRRRSTHVNCFSSEVQCSEDEEVCSLSLNRKINTRFFFYKILHDGLMAICLSGRLFVCGLKCSGFQAATTKV